MLQSGLLYPCRTGLNLIAKETDRAYVISPQSMRVRDRHEGHPKATAAGGGAGFVVIDSFLKPVYMNAEAVRILTYPDGHGSRGAIKKFLAERVQSALRKRGDISESSLVTQIKSGRRIYLCRFFRVSSPFRKGQRPTTGLLIERGSESVNFLQMAEDFHLTQREREAVQLLTQGLTNKEIANRMGISPNTVKAFLRLVMIKTGLTTRSGIIGKLLQNQKRSATTQQSQSKRD